MNRFAGEIRNKLCRLTARDLSQTTCWDRQWEKRLISSLLGVLYSKTANNAGDVVNDISGAVGTAANFNRDAVIDIGLTSLPLLKGLPLKCWGTIRVALRSNACLWSDL